MAFESDLLSTIIRNPFAVLSVGYSTLANTSCSTQICISPTSEELPRNRNGWKPSQSHQNCAGCIKPPIVILVVLVCLINITTQSSVSGVTGSRPIAILHGLGSSAQAMANVAKLIQLREPNRLVITLSCLQGRRNLLSIDDQVDILRDELKSIEAFNTEEGFDFIGHSLGGVIGRAYIHKYNSPHIHRFISIHSPHIGVDPSKIGLASVVVKEPAGVENRSPLGKVIKRIQDTMVKASNSVPVVRDLQQYSFFMKRLNAPLLSKDSHVEQTKLMVLVKANQDRVVVPGESAHILKDGVPELYYRHLDRNRLIYLDHDCGHGIKNAISNANSMGKILKYISAPELDPHE